MTDTKHFKELLEKEAATLESELRDLGKKSDTVAGDWEATRNEDVDAAEDAEVAGGLEKYEQNSAEVEQLEKQLTDVKAALAKIENGKYGICEVCGKEIESDRLEANPSARTCKEHMQ